MSAPSDRALALRVGLLVAGALALLGVFLVTLGGVTFGASHRVRVDFDFSGNLQSGAPVKISGIKVGKVERVDFLAGRMDDETKRRVQVRVTVRVDDRAMAAIHEDAEFYVNTAGVLGEQYLEVVPGSPDRPAIAENAVVRGVDPPRTDLIVARLYEFLDSVTAIVRDDKDALRDVLRSGASLVRTTDEILKENREQIGKLLRHVDQLADEGQKLVDDLERGVGDPARIDRTLANLEAISGTVRKELDPLIARTKKALDGVNNVTGMVGPDEKQKLLGALDELVAVSKKVDSLTTDAQAIASDVRKGKGTAGALLVDAQIYDDLKELVRDLKRNPWKFFWKE